MADKWPAATGNWSTAANWNGGTLPVAGDTVWADGKTITIDQDIDLSPGGSINAGLRSGGTVGGGFLVTTVAGTRTLKFNINGTTSGGVVCLTTSNNTGAIVFTGNITGGSAGFGMTINGSGPVTINGNLVGGSGTNIMGLSVGAATTLTLIGNITAGISGNANGLNSSAANATYYITGNLLGSQTGSTTLAASITGANVNGTITGNITGGVPGNSQGLSLGHSSGTMTITGTVTGGSSSAGIAQSGTGTLNIIGNCVGGVGAGGHGVLVTSACTLNVTGSAIPNDTVGSNGINVTGAGATVRVTRAKGSGYGVGSAGVVAGFGVVNGAQASVYVEELEFGARGQSPVSGPIYITPVSTNAAIFRKSDLTQLTLARSDNAATYGSPAVTDVRHGVSYALGNLTGTAYIPAAGSVDLGVPVDATTGTAVLSAASVRAAIGLASANLDTQIAALPTTTTVNAIKAKTDNLPAAPASTTNITAASGIALAANQHVIVDSGTVTNLTNAPSSVTPAQVWAALTSDLTTAGSIGERLKNAATVDTTGAQLAALA